MAVNDPILSKRNKINKSIQRKLVNVRSGILSSPDARLAAKQTIANTNNTNDEILSILAQIDSQSKSGYFYALVDTPKNSIQKVKDYFTRKKYVVAGFVYPNNKTKICIYWGGGKKWQKSRFGFPTDMTSIGTMMLQEIIAAANSTGITPIRWNLFNPNYINFDRLDETKIVNSVARIGSVLP